MERYSKYKDSGVDWIGEIPEGWKTTAIRHVLQLHSGSALPDDQYDAEGDFPVYGGGAIRGRANQCNVQGQTVIVSRQGATCGTTRFIGGNAWITEHALIAYFLDAMYNKRYFAYVLHAMNLGNLSMTAAQPGISASIVQNQYTPVPNHIEQQAIADYLDEKTAAIDAAVADVERSIELLNEYRQSVISEAVTKGLDPNTPMKDSGIDWIGQIPEYWHTEKAKFLVSITNGSDPKTNGNIPVYGSGEGSFKTCGEYKEGPAVLIGRKGATLHIPHYVTGKYWNVDTAFDVKASNDTISLRYYYYLATCFDYKQYMSQTTLPSMTQTAYWNMALPLPDTAEQNHIVDWLDEHLSQINSLIAQKQSLIVRLKEYRSSLISECVTGKVKVPGVKED